MRDEEAVHADEEPSGLSTVYYSRRSTGIDASKDIQVSNT